MSDIPMFVGSDEQLINALLHMAEKNNLSQTDKSVVTAAADAIDQLLDQIREIAKYD